METTLILRVTLAEGMTGTPVDIAHSVAAGLRHLPFQKVDVSIPIEAQVVQPCQCGAKDGTNCEGGNPFCGTAPEAA